MKTISHNKFFSKLRNFKILDASGDLIGKVGDLLLRKNDLSVYALISHDSPLREKLESWRILNDKDEIIPLHHIDKEIQFPNEIRTTIEKTKLRTTKTNWEIPEDYFLFSELCKADVLDVDGDLIGHITDIIYHDDEGYSIVVDPASYIEHFLEVLHLRHHHDIIIPGDYIGSILPNKIQINIDREQIEKIDALPVHSILYKDKQSYKSQPTTLKKRYHYSVLQAPLYVIKEKIQNKLDKINKAKEMIEITPFEANNDDNVEQFCNLFNEVALTSVDPYEQMDTQKVKDHFAEDSYLAYYLNQPVGYCITSVDHENRIGAIAGIGIHHRQRGKRFSSAMMMEMIDIFEEKELEFVQCDVLTNNDASLGLFKGLGFEQIDDFYLS